MLADRKLGIINRMRDVSLPDRHQYCLLTSLLTYNTHVATINVQYCKHCIRKPRCWAQNC